MKRQWIFNGPDKDFLTKADIVAYFQMANGALERMIENGTFPRGRQFGGKRSEVMWTGADIAAFAHLHDRFQAEDPDKPREAFKGSNNWQPQTSIILNERTYALSELPAELAPVKHQMLDDYDSSCVYFLLRASRIVYVGSARNGYRRVCAHKIGTATTRKKKFDGVFYLPVPLDDVLERERIFIGLIDPPLNKVLRRTPEEDAELGTFEAKMPLLLE